MKTKWVEWTVFDDQGRAFRIQARVCACEECERKRVTKLQVDAGCKKGS